MLAGFASIDITPPNGSVLNGFIARTVPSTGVDAPLSARALWLERNSARCLIVSLDLLGLSPSCADRLADHVAESLGLTDEQVILACTHTHSGPMSCPLRGIGPADTGYLAILEERVLRAAGLAATDRSRVRAAWGSAPVEVAVNRRQMVETADGPTVVLGRNPDGPKDTDVRVLHLHGDGRSIILFHHACHPYCLGGDTTLASADFWGHAAQVLAAEGHQSIYLNGCAGNIAPELAFGGPDAARATGTRLAESVLQARRRARPIMDCTLEMCSRRFALGHAPLPGLDQIESHLAKADRTVRDSERDNPLVVERIRAAWREWLGELKDTLDREGRLPPLPARISVVRIGEGAIVALPGEVFYEIGRDIALGLAADPVCVAAYCHGYIGYVPTPEAFPLGGYEVDESHRYVGLWRISPLAGSVITGQVFDLWTSHGGQLR